MAATLQQQVFSLSWLSNGAAANNWTSADLATQLQNYSSDIGTWSLVWGPVLLYPNGDSSKPVDNAMFVAQGTDASNNPIYVVAIAGTNKSSTYDWFSEDLSIDPVVWPYAGTNMHVTTGDNVGLSNLLSMKCVTPSSPVNPLSLQEFLNTVKSTSSSLWFTGHSLGGALSPMMTLALMDPSSSLNTTNNVSIHNWSQVSLLATAGPSIGDQAFLTYFQNTLSSATLTFIWNGNDVVPHAWNATSMSKLTSPSNIYGLNLDPSSCLAKALANFQSEASANSYVMFDQNPGFTWPVQSYTTPKGAWIQWNPQSEFLAQAAFQHINAYVDYFQCTWFSPSSLLGDPATAYELLLLVNNSLQQNGMCS